MSRPAMVVLPVPPLPASATEYDILIRFLSIDISGVGQRKITIRTTVFFIDGFSS
jgi:hypothetical protein